MDEENLKRLQYELENRGMVTIVLESSLMLLIIMISFIGNSLIICVVFQNPRLHTVTNIFLVSLAIADILTSLLVMPISASIFIQGKWIFSEGVCIFLRCVSPLPCVDLTAFGNLNGYQSILLCS